MPAQTMGDEDKSGSRTSEAAASPSERRLRELPALLGRAVALVWNAAPRELALTGALQLVASGGLAAQLLVSRGLLTQILKGQQHGYGPAVPYIVALAVIIAIVAMVNAARSELQRTLTELVSRYAMGRGLAGSTAGGLLAL